MFKETSISTCRRFSPSLMSSRQVTWSCLWKEADSSFNLTDSMQMSEIAALSVFRQDRPASPDPEKSL